MIYLLEDDDSIRKLVVYTFQSHGMECLGIPHPSIFWNQIDKELPSLILLDIMLPSEDGFSILQKLKQSDKTNKIPVIMLTAKNSETDTVSALDYGADDYIKKPFGTKELIARVNAVLRRCTNSSSENNELTYKKIVLNVKKHTVYVNNQLILLSIKEFCLLKILMENIGSVVKKADIMKSVWNYEDDIESRTVDVHLKNLRKKLNDDGNIIETVRGVGFSIGRKQI